MQTLARYFMRQYFQAIGLITVLLLSLVFFLNIAELFRRTANKANATIGIVFSMGFAQLPQTIETVLPFVVLLGGIFTVWRMTRRQEVVIARASGLSVWRIIMPLLLTIMIVAALNLLLFNAFAAKLQTTFHHLSRKYISEESAMDVSGGGLWLRQTTELPHGHGVAVIHASAIKAGPPLQLNSDVMLLYFDANEQYQGRVDAAAGQLQDGYWLFTQAKLHMPGRSDQMLATFTLPTRLTPARIEDSLARPDELSFWQLPGFINALDRTGFSSVRHRTHYQELLATPLLLAAMLLIAIVFMQRQMRQAQGVILLAFGVGAGTAVFILNNMMLAFGAAGSLPIVLAAWAVPLAACALSLGVLLHLEEGG